MTDVVTMRIRYRVNGAVLTNLHDHYCSPETYSLLDSDHSTLIVHPLNRIRMANKKIIRMKRDHRPSRKAEFSIDIFMFNRLVLN